MTTSARDAVDRRAGRWSYPPRASFVGPSVPGVRPALRGPVVGMGVLLLTAGATPGHGHGIGTGEAVSFLTAPLAAALAVAGLLAGALVAGMALLRGSGPPSRPAAIVAEGGAGYAVAVLALAWLDSGVDAVSALPRTALAVLAALAFVRAPRAVSVLAGAGLVAALAGGDLPAVAQLVAAVLALGVVAHVACAEARVAEARRHTPTAAVAALVLLGTTATQVLPAVGRVDAVSAFSAFGLVAALAGLLLGAAVLSGTRARRSGRWAPVTAVFAVSAVAATAVLGLVPVPVALPGAGAPLVRAIALGGQDTPVAVVPQRPGPNLVWVGDADVTVNGTAATPRDGAAGSWAVVDLPAGTDELPIARGADRAVLRLQLGTEPAPAALTAGLTGPDGPECLSAVAGTLAGGGAQLPDACPSAGFTAADAAAVQATVRFLAGRGAPVLHVIGDGSARSAAASGAATAAAAAAGLPLTDRVDPAGAVLVVAGWESGGRRLVQEALGLSTVHGTYTAPWLATGAVLGRQTGAVTVLDFDPRDVPAQRYVAALRGAGAGELASPAGFGAWSAAVGEPPAGTGPRIFTAVQLSVMPGDHRHATDGWLPGGTFTAVTPALPV